MEALPTYRLIRVRYVSIKLFILELSLFCMINFQIRSTFLLDISGTYENLRYVKKLYRTHPYLSVLHFGVFFPGSRMHVS